MHIRVVTPAGPDARNGNRVTAMRWARILRQLGHRIDVATKYGGESCDVLVAVHAWRSADSIDRFKDTFPEKPLVVLLAGTDVYDFQHREPEVTSSSMARADRLVGLHDRVHRDIPSEFADKLHIIHQSCPPFPGPRQPVTRTFRICVVANLRGVKDPLRAAIAARHVPDSSKLQVIHLGQAESEDWRAAAEEEMRQNSRYCWRGAATQAQVRRCFSNSHAMVISSINEGGANVVSEAIVRGLPVLASDMSGNRGLLGEDYEGYFPVQDEEALSKLLLRAESEPEFLDRLAGSLLRGAKRFDELTERENWRQLLEGLG